MKKSRTKKIGSIFLAGLLLCLAIIQPFTQMGVLAQTNEETNSLKSGYTIAEKSEKDISEVTGQKEVEIKDSATNHSWDAGAINTYKTKLWLKKKPTESLALSIRNREAQGTLGGYQLIFKNDTNQLVLMSYTRRGVGSEFKNLSYELVVGTVYEVEVQARDILNDENKFAGVYLRVEINGTTILEYYDYTAKTSNLGTYVNCQVKSKGDISVVISAANAADDSTLKKGYSVAASDNKDISDFMGAKKKVIMESDAWVASTNAYKAKLELQTKPSWSVTFAIRNTDNQVHIGGYRADFYCYNNTLSLKRCIGAGVELRNVAYELKANSTYEVEIQARDILDSNGKFSGVYVCVIVNGTKITECYDYDADKNQLGSFSCYRTASDPTVSVTLSTTKEYADDTNLKNGYKVAASDNKDISDFMGAKKKVITEADSWKTSTNTYKAKIELKTKPSWSVTFAIRNTDNQVHIGGYRADFYCYNNTISLKRSIGDGVELRNVSYELKANSTYEIEMQARDIFDESGAFAGVYVCVKVNGTTITECYDYEANKNQLGNFCSYRTASDPAVSVTLLTTKELIDDTKLKNGYKIAESTNTDIGDIIGANEKKFTDSADNYSWSTSTNAYKSKFIFETKPSWSVSFSIRNIDARGYLGGYQVNFFCYNNRVSLKRYDRVGSSIELRNVEYELKTGTTYEVEMHARDILDNNGKFAGVYVCIKMNGTVLAECYDYEADKNALGTFINYQTISEPVVLVTLKTTKLIEDNTKLKSGYKVDKATDTDISKIIMKNRRVFEDNREDYSWSTDANSFKARLEIGKRPSWAVSFSMRNTDNRGYLGGYTMSFRLAGNSANTVELTRNSFINNRTSIRTMQLRSEPFVLAENTSYMIEFHARDIFNAKGKFAGVYLCVKIDGQLIMECYDYDAVQEDLGSFVNYQTISDPVVSVTLKTAGIYLNETILEKGYRLDDKVNSYDLLHVYSGNVSEWNYTNGETGIWNGSVSLPSGNASAELSYQIKIKDNPKVTNDKGYQLVLSLRNTPASNFVAYSGGINFVMGGIGHPSQYDKLVYNRKATTFYDGKTYQRPTLTTETATMPEWFTKNLLNNKDYVFNVKIGCINIIKESTGEIWGVYSYLKISDAEHKETTFMEYYDYFDFKKEGEFGALASGVINLSGSYYFQSSGNVERNLGTYDVHDISEYMPMTEKGLNYVKNEWKEDEKINDAALSQSLFGRIIDSDCVAVKMKLRFTGTDFGARFTVMGKKNYAWNGGIVYKIASDNTAEIYGVSQRGKKLTDSGIIPLDQYGIKLAENEEFKLEYGAVPYTIAGQYINERLYVYMKINDVFVYEKYEDFASVFKLGKCLSGFIDGSVGSTLTVLPDSYEPQTRTITLQATKTKLSTNSVSRLSITDSHEMYGETVEYEIAEGQDVVTLKENVLRAKTEGIAKVKAIVTDANGTVNESDALKITVGQVLESNGQLMKLWIPCLITVVSLVVIGTIVIVYKKNKK